MSEELIDAAALGFRFVVALVLLAAAIPKLLHRGEFERAVANYALVPSRLVRPIAIWLPRLELVCAFALLLGVAITQVAALAGVLLLVFALAIAINLARGRRVDCGCIGSVAPRRIGWSLVVADVALSGMAIAAALADPRVFVLVAGPDSLNTSSRSSLSSTDALAILIFTSILVLACQLASSSLAVRSASRSLRRNQLVKT
jgi:uncharacterized membrane protein YphA (DoxX/SURF4 family)